MSTEFELFKGYIEVSVKNDDALIKLAAICQRIISAGSKDDDGNEYGLTDEERSRLLEEAEAEIEKLNPKTEDKDGTSKVRSSTGNTDLAADPV